MRLLPPARLRACRLGWYFNSSIAFMTRARVAVLTTLALFSTRETVAVETLARRATCSRFMAIPLIVPAHLYLVPPISGDSRSGGVHAGGPQHPLIGAMVISGAVWCIL